jgi:hypothetical protein
MRCCDTDRFDELTTLGQSIIQHLAACQNEKFFEEEVESPVNRILADICHVCRRNQILYVFQVLRERHNKQFIFKPYSLYQPYLGQASTEPCEGYEPRLRPRSPETTCTENGRSLYGNRT